MDLAGIRELVAGLSSHDRQDLLRWLKDSEATRLRSERAEARSAVIGQRADTLRGAVAWSLLTLLVFLCVEGFVFRSGWYFKFVQPESSAGQLHFQVFWLNHELPAKVPEVGVAGDSRIAEGFSARTATAAAGDKIHFWNIGVAGSSPRTWYYLLRGGDPDRTRFKTVVLGIDKYADVDGTEDLRNRPTDLFYVSSQLRLTDCPEFADSHPDPAVRHDVLVGCLFKGITMRRDLLDFLADPVKRFDAARDWRNLGHGYIDGYGGKPEDLKGLSMDPATHALTFPPGLKDWQKSSVENTYSHAFAPLPQSGSVTAYRRQWLTKIVDYYAGTKTRIILLELPRGPIPPPESPVLPTAVSELSRRPNVTLLPKEMFHDLERPELFADGLHLNHHGRPIFSERLGRKVAELMGVK